MAERKRLPWYQSATPDQRRGINALAFRRDAEAAIFRTNVDTRTSPSYGENVANAEKQGRRNPLEPRGPKASDDVSRETSDAMERFREVDRSVPIPESRRVSYRGRSGRPGDGAERGGASLRDVIGNVGEYVGETASRVPSDILNTVGFVGQQLDRPRGAYFGSIKGSEQADNPLTGVGGSVRGAVEGFLRPEQFQGRDSSLGERFSDEDVVGPLSMRDIVGGALDVGFDPVDLATGGLVATDLARGVKKGAKAAARGVRAIDDNIAQAAIRQADGQDLRGVDDPVRSLITNIRGAKPLQEQNRELLSQFRARQAGGFSGRLGTGEAGFNDALGGMRGTAERVGFEPLRDKIGPEGADELFTRLKDARLDTFDHASAGTALRNILDGVVPTPSELAQLEKVFPGVTRSLREAKIVSGPSLGDYLRDAVSLPQSIVSSFDVSGLRQTATAAAGHPKLFAKSFKDSLRAFRSEDTFRAIRDDLDSRWYAPLRKDAGVAITTGETGLTKGEGTLISDILNKYAPGYRASQRSYTTLLNLMRDGVFQHMIADSGIPVANLTQDELTRWGRLVNISTGRGELPKFLAETKIADTPLFWAPRLIASRVEMPFEVFSSSPVVRKEAARQLAAFVGINSAVLGMGEKAGVWDVELDPRSADFGQARIGNQRIDPWAGFRPIANLIARLATGERKSTITGEVSDVEAKGIVQDFLRSKLSPATSTGVNLWSGKDSIGDPYSAKDAPGDLLVPLFLRDIVEAVSEEGVRALPGALSAGVGLGVNTYGDSELDKASRAAGFDKPYSQLLPAERQQVDDANPQLLTQRSEDIIARGGTRADYERFKNTVRSQQEASDSKLASGEITAKEWREDRGDRQQQLVGAREVAFASLPDKDRNALDRYYAAVDETMGVDGKPDWDAVDVWVASQSKADRDLIAENTGIGGTPTERAHLALVSGLDDAGFWDLRDQAWSGLLDVMSGDIQREASQFDSYEEYRDTLIDQLSQRIATSMNIPSSVARVRAEQTVSSNPAVQAYTKLLQRERSVWAQANADLAEQALASGYLSPSELNLRSTYGIPASPSRRSSGSAGGLFSGSRGSGGLFD